MCVGGRWRSRQRRRMRRTYGLKVTMTSQQKMSCRSFMMRQRLMQRRLQHTRIETQFLVQV